MRLERLNPRQFDLFRDFVYAKSGIRIDSKKVTLLSNRIRRRVQVGGFEGFDDYYRFLTSPDGSAELGGFLDAVTTNETYFFRTPKQFRWLETEWLTEQIERHRKGQRDSRLRVWSAGCASGAEPYSIAICLAENAFRLRGWSLNVLGTDISEQMLRDARNGIYKDRAVEAVSEKQRRRYFQRQTDDGLWRVQANVKNLVQWKHHNLMEPFGEAKFDCIFIRNVLIYFDAISKQTVINHLLDSLEIGGYLVIGPSEGIYGMLDGLRRISPLVYQRLEPSAEGGSPEKEGGEA